MIYICGDSFGSSDKDYPEVTPWHELIPKSKTLAFNCASNLLIRQQVDQAIKDKAKFIIVSFTSSLRSEIMWNGKITPFSWLSLDDTTPFDRKTLDALKKIFTHIDLSTEIKRNESIIKFTLDSLIDSNIPFCFDQGGFEHPSYGKVGTYFTKYNQYRSKYCLWDYASRGYHRPYFHIEDQSIHNMIADYYNNFIQGRQLD